MPVAAVYTCNRAQGLFAGASIAGTVFVTRGDANRAYDRREVTPREILSGEMKPPPGAAMLVRALERY